MSVFCASFGQSEATEAQAKNAVSPLFYWVNLLGAKRRKSAFINFESGAFNHSATLPERRTLPQGTVVAQVRRTIVLSKEIAAQDSRE